jgi:hypothetical protein
MVQMLVSYSHMSVVLWSKQLYKPPKRSSMTDGSSVKATQGVGDTSQRRDSYTAQQTERAIVNKRKVV